MPTAFPVAMVLLAALAPIAGTVAAPTDGAPQYAECEALAPFEDGCGFTIVPDDGVELMIPTPIAFSGTLAVKAEQNGVTIWNGTCIIPLGFTVGARFRDTGIGACFSEEDQTFDTGEPLDLSVRVGLYGVGTFGLRAKY